VQRALEPYRLELRAEALATVRFETAPGKQLQIDFDERLVEIGGRKVKVFLFVATLGYSRQTHVRAFRHERQEAWFNGLESTFLTFEGVPEEVLFDNARALVIEHDAQSRTVVFNTKLRAFARHWGFRPRACAPYRARTKGKAENGIAYVKKNAIAGRTFASWEALEAHLARWEREIANARIHGTTGEVPLVRFGRDAAVVFCRRPLRRNPRGTSQDDNQGGGFRRREGGPFRMAFDTADIECAEQPARGSMAEHLSLGRSSAVHFENDFSPLMRSAGKHLVSSAHLVQWQEGADLWGQLPTV
jgi:Integrase core domain